MCVAYCALKFWRFVLLVQLVGPDCRILLSKYIEILAFIRRGIVAAGHSAEEAEAFVERHGRVLKELAVVSRITRRVEGTGPGGLLSVQVKTELKAACAAFGSAWTTSYPNRAMTPNGPRYRGARPRLVVMYGICGVFGEDGVEALHVTDSAARRLVRQMRNPEARYKAHALHHTARAFTPLLNREIKSRAKRPRTEGYVTGQ